MARGRRRRGQAGGGVAVSTVSRWRGVGLASRRRRRGVERETASRGRQRETAVARASWCRSALASGRRGRAGERDAWSRGRAGGGVAREEATRERAGGAEVVSRWRRASELGMASSGWKRRGGVGRRRGDECVGRARGRDEWRPGRNACAAEQLGSADGTTPTKSANDNGRSAGDRGYRAGGRLAMTGEVGLR